MILYGMEILSHLPSGGRSDLCRLLLAGAARTTPSILALLANKRCQRRFRSCPQRRRESLRRLRESGSLKRIGHAGDRRRQRVRRVLHRRELGKHPVGGVAEFLDLLLKPRHLRRQPGILSRQLLVLRHLGSGIEIGLRTELQGPKPLHFLRVTTPNFARSSTVRKLRPLSSST